MYLLNKCSLTLFLWQAIDTKEAERQWIVNHLGHTMNIHLTHYRQTSDLLERVQVAKLLLIQDFGVVNSFVGKRLEDIQLEGRFSTTPRMQEKALKLKVVLAKQVPDHRSRAPYGTRHPSRKSKLKFQANTSVFQSGCLSVAPLFVLFSFSLACRSACLFFLLSFLYPFFLSFFLLQCATRVGLSVSHVVSCWRSINHVPKMI